MIPAPLSIRQFRETDVALPAGAQITAHGVTLERDGRVVAVGGIVRVGPHWWTFADIQPEGRRGMVTHRLVVDALRMAEESGITPIYGYCDEAKPLAKKWIKAIGFRPIRDSERDDAIAVVERWCGRTAWIRELSRGN